MDFFFIVEKCRNDKLTLPTFIKLRVAVKGLCVLIPCFSAKGSKQRYHSVAQSEEALDNPNSTLPITLRESCHLMIIFISK